MGNPCIFVVINENNVIRVIEIIVYHEKKFEEYIIEHQLTNLARIWGKQAWIPESDYFFERFFEKNFFPSGTNYVIWLAQQVSINEDFRETFANFSRNIWHIS